MRTTTTISLLSFLLPAALAQAAPAWPPDNQWIPLTTNNGQPVTDPANDSMGGNAREVVGPMDTAVYIWSDANNLCMRMRLDTSPVSKGELVPFGWGCEIDTNGNLMDYELLVMADGINNPDVVRFEQNTITKVANDPNDVTEVSLASYPGTPLMPVGTAYVRSVAAPTMVNGTADAFIDFCIDIADLRLRAMVPAATPLRFLCGSSSNAHSLQGDLISASGATTISGAISDPYQCDANGCHACNTNAACGAMCAACVAPLGVCNPMTWTCVGCLSNLDCVDPANPACNPATKTCGKCTTDVGCAGRPATPACQPNGTCGECSMTNTTLCVGGTTCNVATGRCTGCTKNADCANPLLPTCDVNQKLCVKCANDAGCTGHVGTPACQPGGTCGQCSQTNTALCMAPTPACDTTAGKCVACVKNSDCTNPATPTCDLATKTCVKCATDAGCVGVASGPACQPDGTCKQCSQTNKARCMGATPVCDVANGVCVGCVTNADCPSPMLPQCDPMTKTCVKCTSDAGCSNFPATPACNLGTGACVECTQMNQAMCKPPTMCDVMLGRCTGCRTNADCTNPAFPTCDAMNGACIKCTTDAGCTGHLGTPACQPSGACGECSMTNKALCMAPTPMCDVAQGKCVACTTNADCMDPQKPQCDPMTHTCGPCTTDAGCAGNAAGPACQPNGTCNQCSQTNRTQCMGATPVCDVGAGRCVGCIVNADCKDPQNPTCLPQKTCGPCKDDMGCVGVPAGPACQPNGTCNQCSETNKTECRGGTPVCDVRAGRCVPCVPAGDGGGDATACAGSPDGVACVPGANGGLPFCGCLKDADCGARDSGRVCDGVRSKCVDGCSPAPERNNCPKGLFCSSNDVTGKVIGACTMTCNFDPDCASTMPALPLCLLGGDAGPNACVQCRVDADCAGMPAGRTLCATDTHMCVECTDARKDNCKQANQGAECLMNRVCGCTKDADCGGATSGRICDANAKLCGPGCRGTDGNGCPDGEKCSSTTRDPGTCTPSGDMAVTPAVPDGGEGQIVGGGFSCAVDRGARGSSSLALLALALLGLLLRRRARHG